MSSSSIHVGHHDAARAVIDATDAAWRAIDEAAGRVEPRKPLPAKASHQTAPAQVVKKASQTRAEPPRKGTGIDRSATIGPGRVGQGGQGEPGRERPNEGVVRQPTEIPPGYLLLSPDEVTAMHHLIDTHPDLAGPTR